MLALCFLDVSLFPGGIRQFVSGGFARFDVLFSLLRLSKDSEYIRCIMDPMYAPKIIHYSGAPKPTDFLFKRKYYFLHEVKMEMTVQERPRCVPWVDKVERVYEEAVIDPQIRRHDLHLRRDVKHRIVRCEKCKYPMWTDKKHTPDLCQENVEYKRKYSMMHQAQVNYDKMATRFHVKFLYEIVWPSMIWSAILMVLGHRPDGSCPGVLFVIGFVGVPIMFLPWFII